MSDDINDGGKTPATGAEAASESTSDSAAGVNEDGSAGKAGDKLVHLRPPRPCPSCGKPSTRKAYPFCSSRCADVDLNRWLTGQFVIPGRALNDADEDEEGAAGSPLGGSGEPD